MTMASAKTCPALRDRRIKLVLSAQDHPQGQAKPDHPQNATDPSQGMFANMAFHLGLGLCDARLQVLRPAAACVDKAVGVLFDFVAQGFEAIKAVSPDLMRKIGHRCAKIVKVNPGHGFVGLGSCSLFGHGHSFRFARRVYLRPVSR
jgi:hypothetical protein